MYVRIIELFISVSAFKMPHNNCLVSNPKRYSLNPDILQKIVRVSTAIKETKGYQ